MMARGERDVAARGGMGEWVGHLRRGIEIKWGD